MSIPPSRLARSTVPVYGLSSSSKAATCVAAIVTTPIRGVWPERPTLPHPSPSLLDQAERYRAYWGAEGGITVSGGEALLQIDGLIALFERAHRRGINTCLDTAAQPFTRREPFYSKFLRLMKSTDTVLLDLKHIDSEAHRQLTGHGNENILDCARCLSELGVPVWIRHVLVPGLTDDEEQLRRLRAFIDTLTNVQRVEVLPYHTLGVFKWKELGLRYTLDDVPVPTAEQVARAEQILQAKA